MSDLNACRHFKGMYPDDRPACAKGRDVRAWATRCNGGSTIGIGLRLPCTKQRGSTEKSLFDCPELDRKTQEEVDQQRAAMSAHMDRFVSALPKINEMKARMIAKGARTAKATCPWCGEKSALRISVAIGVNNHARAQCESCGEGFIE